ncbi:MAG: flavodoxin family protein [Butyrivibrio sp.]|nr:flavodoxin family protein [Butyrivibrio sp.]
MKRYLVAYASETGNTLMLAKEIHNAINCPKDEKELVDIRSWNGTLDAELYFIGFWINRGSCSLEIIDLISSLHGKNVAFFGTCGLGDSYEYHKMLEQNARAWLAEDNNFLGSFFCLGKMPVEIRNRYESLRGNCGDVQIDFMLSMLDDAASHPDNQDLLRVRLFTDEMLIKAENYTAAYI